MDFNEIEFTMGDTTVLWRRLFNIILKPIGLPTNERRALVETKRNPGLTQIELARKLDIEPQNMLRVLDRLEAKEWIIKEDDPADRRAKRIYLTASAEPILQEMLQLGAELHEKAIEDITVEELKACQDCLEKIRKNLLESTKVV